MRPIGKLSDVPDVEGNAADNDDIGNTENPLTFETGEGRDDPTAGCSDGLTYGGSDDPTCIDPTSEGRDAPTDGDIEDLTGGGNEKFADKGGLEN